MSTPFEHSTAKHTAASALAAFALLLASDARAGARIVREHAARPRAQSAQSAAPSKVRSGDAKPVREAPPALPVPTPDAPEPSELVPAPAPMDHGVADTAGGNELVPGVYLRTFGGVVRRSLSFSQDVYDRLRTLNTNLYVYRMVASVYPSFRATPLRGHVGLIAGYENAFAGSVHDENFGSNYPIVHSELFGGVRVRRAVRGHELGFDLTIGRLTSGLDDGGSGRAGTPDISYSEARSALDLTVQLGGVRVNGALGFRVPFSYGQIAEAEWFPRVGGYGMEASTWASYPVANGVSAEAALSLRHYVLEMNSEPEDSGAGIAEVAGGAVDAFFGGYIGMSFAL